MGIVTDVDFDTMAQSSDGAQDSNQEIEVVIADLRREVMLGASDCVEEDK